MALGGAASGNYVLAGNTLSANIGTITPATLTARLTGTVGKVYDGTTAATLTAANYTLSGVIGGDNVSLNDPTAGTFATANVGGNIGVSISGLALGGAASGNYVLAGAALSANVGTITPATLTAGLTGTVSKVFDGTTVAMLAPANYDSVGRVEWRYRRAQRPKRPVSMPRRISAMGSGVSVSGLALTGAAAGNYVLASDFRERGHRHHQRSAFDQAGYICRQQISSSREPAPAGRRGQKCADRAALFVPAEPTVIPFHQQWIIPNNSRDKKHRADEGAFGSGIRWIFRCRRSATCSGL